MQSGATREVSVLVVDDNDASATWDLRFRADEEAGDADDQAARRFIRYGDVCTTPQAARAALLRALREGLIPDVVLLDHILSDGGIDRQRVPAGLGLMRWLRDRCAEFGAPVPPCVLWTAEYSPGLAYAFVESGGRHAFGRDVPAAEVVHEMWNVLDFDARWRPRAPLRRLELTESLVRLLPYFEANLPTHEIAQLMRQRDEMPATIKDPQSWVNDGRRQIMSRANDLCAELGLPRFDGKGLSVALAKFAVAHGHVWIPLAYREG